MNISAGDKFGRLTVIGDSGERSMGHIMFNCLCKCGNNCRIKSSRLASGNTRSCGCLNKDKRRGRKYKQSKIQKRLYRKIGTTIHRLTLIDLKKEHKGKTIAILRCVCGNIIEKDLHEFTKGKVKSCGCIRKEISILAKVKKVLKEIQRDKPKFKLPYKPPKDYTGLKIGHLAVLYWCGVRITKGGRKLAIWQCQCDCGNITIKTSTALKSSNPNCGCVFYENRRKRALQRAEEKRNTIIALLDDNKYLLRDDIDHKNRRLRRTIKHSLLIKYPNGCAICGTMGDKSNKLCAHHYKPHSAYPQYRYMLSNQVILCEKCHNKLHKTLGYMCTSIPLQAEYIICRRETQRHEGGES